MNADRLLALFEQISEAPDAISRLRRFILDLAVRGKLVEQDPEDEPAEELLKRLAHAKQKLIDSKLIKKPKPWMPIAEKETPVSLPKNWAWSRLCDIGRLAGGMTPSMSRPDYWDGDISWLSPKDIKADEVARSEMKITAAGLEETRLELYPPGSLFIVARSGILKRTLPVAINRVPAAANQDLKVLVPYLKGGERYLQIMFRGLTDFLLKELVKTGTTVQSLKYAEFEQQAFPLPPLAEQHRIVAKVDELMALCDQLEASRTQREQCREHLVAASLQRLNQPSDDPEAFRSDARFALQVLPSLTSTPAQIKQLRQTILNLAVRGRLVEQDPEDEPADVMLNRLENKQKKRRSHKGGVNHYTSTSRFLGTIPAGWELARFDEVARVKSNLVNPALFPDMPHIAPDCVEGWTARLLPYKTIAESGVTSPKHYFEPGSILYSKIRPGLAKVVAVDFEGLCSADMYPIETLASREYLIKFMISPLFVAQATAGDNRVAMPKINQAALSEIAVPLPPLAEQHRIVAKVDELMALCDQLEQQLNAGEQLSRKLLEAVLTEALAGRLPERP